MMDQRQKNLMRGWVDAGISAARFNLGRGRMLLQSLGVPMEVINRVIHAATMPLELHESGVGASPQTDKKFFKPQHQPQRSNT